MGMCGGKEGKEAENKSEMGRNAGCGQEEATEATVGVGLDGSR